MIKTIDKVLTTVETKLLQVLFILMTIVTLVQVFNRVLFNYPMPWGDELARYLFVWVVYLASSYAVREKAHIGVTALVDRFSLKAQKVVELVMNIFCCAFSMGIFVLALKIMIMQAQMGQHSPSMRLPMQYAYAGLAVGGLFMAIRLVLQVCMFFTEFSEEKIA